MRRCRRLVVLLTLLVSAALEAQEEPSDTTVVPIPEVTVTVLRTPLTIGRAPFSVAVNDAVRIGRGQPGLGLDEALRGIPGVQVDNRYNHAVGERISIRGFGARAQFGVRGVRVLVDGIPATLPDGQTALSHVDLTTLRRAEVIRGPASALYGNTAGGVIQLETKSAPDAVLGQELRLVSGTSGLLRLHSSTGGTRGPTSYLLNVSGLEYDGYREFSAARNRYVGGRLGHESGPNQLRLTFSAVDSEAENPGSLSLALLEEDRHQAFSNNVRQRTGKSATEAQVGASWRRTLPEGAWETTIFGISRDVRNPIPTAIIELDRGAYGARSLVRGGAAGRLEWAFGAEADRQRDARRNFANLQGEPGALTLDQRESVTNLAAFAQLTTTISDRWTLLAGARYDWFRFAVDDRLVGPDEPDDSGSRRMDAVSPSLGANVRITEGMYLYGNVGTSFETPTTTELANRPGGPGGFNPHLQPQRALSVEGGAQGRLRSVPLVYQLAAYRAALTNSLIPFEVPESPGRQFFRNAGSAVHRGIEAAVTVVPFAPLRVHAAYTLTDARFRDYATGSDRFDGNRVPGIAPHRLELTATVESGGAWFATAEVRSSSRMAADDSNSAFSPAYSLLDLRLGNSNLRFGSVRVEPFAGVTNVLDTRYNTAVAINAFGQRFFEPGPGRSVYLGTGIRL